MAEEPDWRTGDRKTVLTPSGGVSTRNREQQRSFITHASSAGAQKRDDAVPPPSAKRTSPACATLVTHPPSLNDEELTRGAKAGESRGWRENYTCKLLYGGKGADQRLPGVTTSIRMQSFHFTRISTLWCPRIDLNCLRRSDDCPSRTWTTQSTRHRLFTSSAPFPSSCIRRRVIRHATARSATHLQLREDRGEQTLPSSLCSADVTGARNTDAAPLPHRLRPSSGDGARICVRACVRGREHTKQKKQGMHPPFSLFYRSSEAVL